jgi:pimeloyl-ACP methyl ester carboxylesterase
VTLPPRTRIAALVVLLAGLGVPAAHADTSGGGLVRVWTVHYRTHAGVARNAYVLLPAWYGPRKHPPIPLIISPHGRGLTGRNNVRIWGGLPARGPFAVVSPDGHGRRLSRYSWGARGQISDLARMPTIVMRALPWLRVDRNRIYAFGGSMGGQETLLLLARYPRLLAGAAAFDAVVDLAFQYYRFPRLRCNGRCKRVWRGPLGPSLQTLAGVEIGGSPATHRYAYELRSPITYARAIAASCVPLQLWWSRKDGIVVDQASQTGRLLKEIVRLNPDAPVTGFVGYWRHSEEMRATARLPVALEAFGLLPLRPHRPLPLVSLIPPPATSALCLRD